MINDFEKFSLSRGVSSLTLYDYKNSIKNSINPMILEERQMNVVGLDVFSRLMYDRILFIGDEIDNEVANIINAQLFYLESNGNDNDDISIYINSPGGSVVAGLAIYDIMNYIKQDVATYCMGMAASMGAILLSSGAKGKRYSLPHGSIMIHQPLGGIRPHSQASDIVIEAQEIAKCKETLNLILSENTGKDIDTITRDTDRNFWMTSKEALEYGMIDEIKRKR